jgi:hypothetical protein
MASTIEVSRHGLERTRARGSFCAAIGDHQAREFLEARPEKTVKSRCNTASFDAAFPSAAAGGAASWGRDFRHA